VSADTSGEPHDPQPLDAAAFARACPVSRETLARLKLYVGLLADWNSRMNLVSAASLPDVWRRHVWDSAQLATFIPAETRNLVDLGSGAGFPGLVLATMLGPEVRTVLYESIAKKCRFLEEVAARLALNVEVRNTRIEEASPEPFDIVTARACAPLTRLLSYAERFQGKSTRCLFLKGQTVGAELSEATKDWDIVAIRHTSLSDPAGTVLEIREFNHARRR
jgi:16S rRNA (guanine527-N7)-methyltransferase